MARLSRSRAALRVTGDDVIPDEITRLLGAAPTRSFARGDTRTSPNTGETRTYKHGAWILAAEDRAPEDLDGQTEEILSRLTSDLTVWRELGGRFELDLFCGLFMAHSNEGGGLSAATMRALGERGIELSLDVYDPSDSATDMRALGPSRMPLDAQAWRFHRIANDFRHWCEHGLESPTPQGLVNEARTQLAGLYASALRLPIPALIEAEQVIADARESEDASALVPRPPALDAALEETIQARFARLPFGLYRSFPTPQAADDEAVTRDLRESLLDVVRGLWRGLWLCEQGHELAALWEWRFALDVHWGTHITAALQALEAFDGDNSREGELHMD